MADVQDTLTNISKYYKSFSGTDTLVFALFPGSQPVVLGSITTISYSCYRSKKPVVNLGRININGVTRGTRIYAGTMIFTLINQYWLRDVQEQDNTKWLKNYKDLKVDELPLFDLMIVSANEYGSYVYMYIYGVDFTDSAQTLSVEDLFTENTFSFVARDVQDFKAGTVMASISDKSESIVSAMTVGTTIFSDDTSTNESTTTDPTLDYYNKQTQKKESEAIRAENKKYESTFNGEVHYSTTSPVISDYVGDIQANLTLAGYETPISMIYDSQTKDAVTSFQIKNGYYDHLGVYDYKTHNLLMKEINGEGSENKTETSIVINRSGAYIYEHPTIKSNVVSIKDYNQQVEIFSKHKTCDEILPSGEYPVVTDGEFDYYRIKEGYVLAKDVYNPFDKEVSREFPTLTENTYSYYVKILQDTLVETYGDFEFVDGLLDKNTLDLVNKIQIENNIEPTDYIDQEVWKTIIGINAKIDKTTNDVSINYKIVPGEYHIKTTDSTKFLNSILDTTINTTNETYVKVSAVCYYDNNKKTVNSQTFLMEDGLKIPDTVLKNSLSYHKEYGSPTQVRYFIYPYNKEAFSWNIYIGG